MKLRKVAGMRSTLLYATWRKRRKWAIEWFQQSWSQSKQSHRVSGKWTLQEVLRRALKRHTLCQTTSELTETQTYFISALLVEWLRLMKSLWETMYKRRILPSRDRSQTRVDSLRTIWAKMRRRNSKQNLRKRPLQSAKNKGKKVERCLNDYVCVPNYTKNYLSKSIIDIINIKNLYF